MRIMAQNVLCILPLEGKFTMTTSAVHMHSATLISAKPVSSGGKIIGRGVWTRIGQFPMKVKKATSYTRVAVEKRTWYNRMAIRTRMVEVITPSRLRASCVFQPNSCSNPRWTQNRSIRRKRSTKWRYFHWLLVKIISLTLGAKSCKVIKA